MARMMNTWQDLWLNKYSVDFGKSKSLAEDERIIEKFREEKRKIIVAIYITKIKAIF